MFHKEHLEFVVSELEAYVPFLHGKIRPIFEKERARLHRTSGGDHVHPPVCDNSILAINANLFIENHATVSMGCRAYLHACLFPYFYCEFECARILTEKR